MEIGKFTVSDDEWVDIHIESLVKRVVDEIVKNVDGVVSIYLTGGFGRGEGSAVTALGKVAPLKDFDFVVVTKKHPGRRAVQRLEGKILRNLNIIPSTPNLYTHGQFKIDLIFRRPQDMKVNPDIWTYELKVASKLVFGSDTRDLIPWTVKDIPRSCGLRILFEQVTGMIGALSPERLEKWEVEETARRHFIYECKKRLVEMCTALCILTGRYEPSYRERVEEFKSLYSHLPTGLCERLPDLKEDILEATKFKLEPKFPKISPIPLWFRTRHSLLMVLQFYIEEYFGIKSCDDFILINQKLRKKMTREYLKPLIASVLRSKLRTEFGTTIITLGIQPALNVKYLLEIVQRYHGLPLLGRWESPGIRIFVASPLVLSAVNDSSGVDQRMLLAASRELQYCIPIGRIGGWADLRRCYLQAYNSYSGPR
jgi:hypothetical protein